jgi:hypothetical protein
MTVETTMYTMGKTDSVIEIPEITNNLTTQEPIRMTEAPKTEVLQLR